MAKPEEHAIGNWRSADEARFRSFIEQQIGLCRFFGRRRERYFDPPLSSCKAPAEVAEREMEFLNKMAED